jgi:hypothetical protein
MNPSGTVGLQVAYGATAPSPEALRAWKINRSLLCASRSLLRAIGKVPAKSVGVYSGSVRKQKFVVEFSKAK